MGTTPIFEQSTSPLYYSNDGRLRVERIPGQKPRVVIDEVFVVKLDGNEVISTKSRVVVDAYIAGYDLRDARDEYRDDDPTGHRITL